MTLQENRDKLIRAAYALALEGVEIVQSRTAPFPTMIVLNPSERLRRKGFELVTVRNGVRLVRHCASENGVNVYWQ